MKRNQNDLEVVLRTAEKDARSAFEFFTEVKHRYARACLSNNVGLADFALRVKFVVDSTRGFLIPTVELSLRPSSTTYDVDTFERARACLNESVKTTKSKTLYAALAVRCFNQPAV